MSNKPTSVIENGRNELENILDYYYGSGHEQPCSEFRRKVLLRCIKYSYLVYIEPEPGQYWEGDGILMYMDIYGQYHLFFDTDKYIGVKEFLYKDGIGERTLMQWKSLEEALDFVQKALIRRVEEKEDVRLLA